MRLLLAEDERSLSRDVSYEEVLKTIRDKKNLIPILMLTAKAEIDDKVEGLDLGANDYLTKPFAAKELLARIRTMIRTQTTQTESILYVGNITLNRATFELTSPTGSFRLANKEFQMMEVFLCNQGPQYHAQTSVGKNLGR